MLIGYYPGCWDLLHVGHIRTLQYARAQCDILIAGVPTDEVIIEDKGRIPVVTTEHRQEMLMALSCVDFAVIYEELDFMHELRKFRPSKLFVGPQWGSAERHTKAEAFMNETGGELVRISIPNPVTMSATHIKHLCHMVCCDELEQAHIEARQRIEQKKLSKRRQAYEHDG